MGVNSQTGIIFTLLGASEDGDGEDEKAEKEKKKKDKKKEERKKKEKDKKSKSGGRFTGCYHASYNEIGIVSGLLLWTVLGNTSSPQ